MVESQSYQYVKLVDGNYQIVTEELPQPGAGEVLIRIAYSTINPFDKAVFSYLKTPRIGSDGSGTIEAVGDGVSAELVGKKVAFLGDAWGQYKLANAHSLIILDDNQDLTKAANACVNPLTALAQLHLAKKHGATAVIITAATSQLAKQFSRLSQQEGIEVINIVRRDDAVEQLKNENGAKYALNQTSETFLADLAALNKELKPTFLIDYISGDIVGKIFATMPQKSHILVVGNQTGSTLNLNSGDILFNDKTISGFMLHRFLISIPAEERQKILQRVSDDLRDGGKIFGSTIVKEIPLANYLEGLNEQTQVATDGKILINCQ
ncbi:zinc-binding dehydrogenase family protein [Stylonychia lemnae]|uniref:Zinc-binding dehydrogenase family protein n=1 Tax=Stylonychia lemnae TaxID=5949 RepID=A0A078AUU1_STYLE|nr:zinc-binding dehydrogenase family protein [Stylonychia lemnae]|eukprot:CDW85776.1 zinc-binding dehydrogenase family protein [Stylonychia lemnae]